MFYESAELDQNYVTLETVKLELFAGGMSVEEERQISEKLVNKENHQVKMPSLFQLEFFGFTSSKTDCSMDGHDRLIVYFLNFAATYCAASQKASLKYFNKEGVRETIFWD